MSSAVAWPYIFLLGAATLCLVGWGRTRLQFSVSIFSAVGLLVSALNLLWLNTEVGPQVLQMGSWDAPYGITFVVDVFSAIMLVVAGVLAVVVNVASLNAISDEHKRKGFYFLANTMLLGVCAAFSTGDLFNLYVCFELMLLSSFVLLSLGKTKAQLEASIKYVVLNFVGSLFFLIAVALIYGLMGSLNFAHLALITQEAPLDGVEVAAVLLLMVAFALKAGLFPLFSWLPASYHTPPTLVTAFFAGLLTKVGIYSLIRVFSLVFPLSNLPVVADVLWWVSVLTMVVGVIGAVAQLSMSRILSVHIISQVGYISLALALFSPKALAAGLFYLVHNIFAKTALFLITAISEKHLGTDNLKKTGGLFKNAPLLSVLFLICALALAGIPPLSGFFAKLFVAQAAIELSDYWALLAVFGVSVLTLFSMLKIWNEAFWKTPLVEFQRLSLKEAFPLYSGVLLLALLIVLMGVYSSDVYSLFELAGNQLFAPRAYLDAVLGVPEL